MDELVDQGILPILISGPICLQDDKQLRPGCHHLFICFGVPSRPGMQEHSCLCGRFQPDMMKHHVQGNFLQPEAWSRVKGILHQEQIVCLGVTVPAR